MLISDSIRKVIVITGPTASGKSAVAIEVASRLGAVIVSADSMQVYRGMDIGTAKPSPQERAIVPHYMLDVVSPAQEYSVSQYSCEVLSLIKELPSSIPVIIVGGTGLYISSVIYEMNFGLVPKDNSIRNELNAELLKYGCEHMHELLCAVDGLSAQKIHPNDSNRVLRALEIYRSTGIAKSTLATVRKPRFASDIFVIEPPREELYQAIDSRVDKMIEAGLVSEVEGLLKGGISPKCQSMQAIGYKEIIFHLTGDLSLAKAIELIKKNSRNYAKRQLTYFRGFQNAIWTNCGNTLCDILLRQTH